MGIMPSFPDPFIPATLPQCPPWCEGGHGGEDAGAEADGLHHYGAGTGMWLYDIVNTASGRVIRVGGYEVDLSLQQVDSWDGPRGLTLIGFAAHALPGDDDALPRSSELPLTPGEARSVAAGLLHLADLAEELV